MKRKRKPYTKPAIIPELSRLRYRVVEDLEVRCSWCGVPMGVFVTGAVSATCGRHGMLAQLPTELRLGVRRKEEAT